MSGQGRPSRPRRPPEGGGGSAAFSRFCTFPNLAVELGRPQQGRRTDHRGRLAPPSFPRTTPLRHRPKACRGACLVSMGESAYDRINDYGAVKIGLASPYDIRSWSFGEVKKPETINYRTYRPEKDDLFCERIFGPEKDWECACGKYRGMKYKGMICDRCGVKVTHSRVRRKRMGHIELAAPVVHIWFFKAMRSRLGTLLNMKTTSLEKIIYFQDYVITDPGEQKGQVVPGTTKKIQERELLSEEEFRRARETLGEG